MCAVYVDRLIVHNCVHTWAEAKPLGLCSGKGAALVSRSTSGMTGALTVSVGAKASEIELIP